VTLAQSPIRAAALAGVLSIQYAHGGHVWPDPVAWVTRRLGEHLWSKQREILESVRDNRRTAVYSCHESGKSYTAARAVAWWIDSHAPGEAFVVTTAPTGAQVRAILWKEINRAHDRGHLSGRTNQTEWFVGNELVAFGRKPSDYDTEAFQGIHAQYVLVIIDEANGVPKGLWDAADTLIANETGRLLAIGNPDDPNSYFAKTCQPGSGFNVIHISAFDTPNFTGEEVPDAVAASLISPMWAAEKATGWGEDSPLYISKVLGEFPAFASDAVVPFPWAQQCRVEGQARVGDVIELGMDVGAGGDETVLRERIGNVAGRVWKDHSSDPAVVFNLAMQKIRETHATALKIDVIGIGWAVAGWVDTTCRDEGIVCDIVRVNVAESPQDRERFVNLRDEIWWEVGREWCREGRWDLSGCDDDVVAQLIAPKYSLQRGGRIKVEPKDEVRKRLGRSPDDADALLLAFYSPPREVWAAY
jgi:hypothetical protein